MRIKPYELTHITGYHCSADTPQEAFRMMAKKLNKRDPHGDSLTIVAIEGGYFEEGEGDPGTFTLTVVFE